MTSTALAQATIDLAAITRNARVLLARHGDGYVADVSADAFGHGALRSAVAASDGGIRAFFTRDAGIREALRDGGLSVSVAPGAQSRAELFGLTSDDELPPAMRVTSVIVATKTISAGEGVSYGYTWRAPSRTNLALVGIGYADGLDRGASNIGSLWLGGIARPIAGRVAMNAAVLDLGEDEARVGDEVEVFGLSRSAIDWADSIGSNAETVASVFGVHLKRTWVDS